MTHTTTRTTDAVAGPEGAATDRTAPAEPPILSLQGASVVHRSNGRELTALHPLDLEVHRGRSLGVVGESGAGKTTLLSLLLGLRRPTSGRVLHAGVDLWKHRGARAARAALRRDVQVVFQDPYTSLDPRMRISAIVTEGLHDGDRASRRARAVEVLERVGLEEDVLGRFPGAFSGGQRQRIAIARALAPSPRVLIADEPVSALDVLVRRQVVSLLGDLTVAEGLTLVVVSHDIGLVADLCERTLVLNAGRKVESGPTGRLLTAPGEEYTRRLLAAVPRMP